MTRKKIIIVGGLLAILLANTLAALVSGNQLRYPDERDYHQLAGSLISHQAYQTNEGCPTAYRPPGYPLLLSALYRISERPLAAKLFNALAAAVAACFLACLIARITLSGAVVSCVLVFVYPLFVYAGTTLYPQLVGAMLLMASLFLLVTGEQRPALLICSGLIYGCLCLMIPAFLLLLPVICIAMLFTRPPLYRLGYSGLFILCVILVLVPWSIRNYRLFDVFIPVSTNSGVNLLLGNSEHTEGGSGVNVDISKYMQHALGMTESERDTYYKKEALTWIKENPGKAVELYCAKVLNYFNFRNKLYVQQEASIYKDLVLFVSYYPLLLIALVRLIFLKKFPMCRVEFLFYLLYFGNALVSAVFFTRIRFRIPFDYLLIGICSISIGRVWDRRYLDPTSVHPSRAGKDT